MKNCCILHGRVFVMILVNVMLYTYTSIDYIDMFTAVVKTSTNLHPLLLEHLTSVGSRLAWGPFETSQVLLTRGWHS